MQLFQQGKDFGTSNSCSQLQDTKEALVRQFVVPLLQGLYKYLYLVATEATEQQRAELFAFCWAVLPYVNLYTPSAATILQSNCLLTNQQPISDSVTTVKTAVEAAYPAMGITCADVGGYVDTDSTGTVYYEGLAPCNDASTGSSSSSSSSDGSLDVGLVVLIVILVLIVVAILVFIGLYYYHRKGAGHMSLDEMNHFEPTGSQDMEEIYGGESSVLSITVDRGEEQI